MTHQPLTMARRHVLGELYSRCEPVVDVPVYLNDTAGELLGYADESHGKYADAFTFHIADDICKKLAAGHFTYSFEYEFADQADSGLPSSRRRIQLSSILLIMRKGYEKPVSRSVQAAKAEAAKAV